jgi:hypothetical protein
MPSDERIRFDVPQSIAPLEHSAQSRHHPPRGIGGPSWFNLPLLKQRQLLPEEQILGCKDAARPDPDREKAAEIEQHDHRSNKAMPQSGEQTKGASMNAQDRTLRRYKMLPHIGDEVFADDTRYEPLKATKR